jgi:mxaJ protein
LDDPRLKTLKIGVQMIGNDATNTPPAHALADRGITSNVRGYMLYGDYRTPNPAAAIVSAVAKGDIDVALVWGPLAGYFSGQSATPLRLQPVPMATDSETWPMSFNIAMGVRKGDTTLRDELDRVLDRDRPQIEAILREYRIQQAPLERAD